MRDRRQCSTPSPQAGCLTCATGFVASEHRSECNPFAHDLVLWATVSTSNDVLHGMAWCPVICTCCWHGAQCRVQDGVLGLRGRLILVVTLPNGEKAQVCPSLHRPYAAFMQQ